MVMADRLSDKTLNTNHRKNKSKQNNSKKRRRKKSVPKNWESDDPIQLKYDEMISKLVLPVGYVFWGHYFRWLAIPECTKVLLRVRRLARKKEDGSYETHAIMCKEGIPYLSGTVDLFLELMRDSEECNLEENEKLGDRDKSYIQWLKVKKKSEMIWLDQLNLSLKNTADEISAKFIKKLSRQFFQNSRLKIWLLPDLPT